MPANAPHRSLQVDGPDNWIHLRADIAYSDRRAATDPSVMYFVVGFLIDAAVLMLVLVMAGQGRTLDNFKRPLAVILSAAVINAILGLILRGVLWGIPQFILSIAVLYFLIGAFFDLPVDRKRAAVAAYIAIRYVIGLLFSAVAIA